MTDTSLSKEQGLKLVQKLARDDAFRARFEEKPAAALVELGVAADTVVNLPTLCLVPRKLAEKSAFEAASQGLDDATLNACLNFQAPTLKIPIGQ